MKRIDKAKKIGIILDNLYPETPIPLDHSSSYTLLVAVMLSAQTTDKKVNQVTPNLFSYASTPEQMNKLEASNSTDFDRLYLNLMIRHHDGAIDMVDRLNEFPGSAYDPQLYEFVTDLENDQAVEIERMNGILISLSDDPRAGLKPGVYDAGIAILNMELTASLKKPTGFFDPDNPLERGVVEPEEDDESGESQVERSIESLASSQRYPMLSFSNTDMAFTKDLLVA